MLRRLASVAPRPSLLACHHDLPGLWLAQRQYQTAETALGQLALTNKGVKHGPGGRSSVSGVVATVFGCSGFLGRYVVNALARAGSQVVVPYRADDLDVQHLKQMGDLGQIVMIKDFNMRKDEHVETAIKRSNVVINLIGTEKETWNFSFDEVHVEFAERIARASAANSEVERLLHVSCLGAAPDAPSRRLRTKYMGEEAVKRLFPNYTIFRPSVMVGIEDRYYNSIAKLAKQLPMMPLVGGGSQRVQPVYVRDVAEAMLKSLQSEKSVRQTYVLAGPQVFTTEEIVRLVYDTIREQYSALPVPSGLAQLLARPREALLKRVPLPWPRMFTADYLAEAAHEYLAESAQAGALTFADLGVQPRPVDVGIPIEHIRHYRAGGYDFGTTSGTQGTGGAGFSGGRGHSPASRAYN